MKKIAYPVKCPLMNGKQIEKYTCFEIHTVVQGESPESIAPSEVLKHRNYADICKNCKYHRND